MKLIVPLLLVFIVLNSCKKNNTQPAVSSTNNNAKVYVPFCSETQSYSINVKPIIMKNCYNCHTYDFSSYSMIAQRKDKIKNFITNDIMPPDGAKLPNAEKQAILCWIDQGAPNN